jgi:hypothetical protein
MKGRETRRKREGRKGEKDDQTYERSIPKAL